MQHEKGENPAVVGSKTFSAKRNPLDGEGTGQVTLRKFIWVGNDKIQPWSTDRIGDLILVSEGSLSCKWKSFIFHFISFFQKLYHLRLRNSLSNLWEHREKMALGQNLQKGIPSRLSHGKIFYLPCISSPCWLSWIWITPPNLQKGWNWIFDFQKSSGVNHILLSLRKRSRWYSNDGQSSYWSLPCFIWSMIDSRKKKKKKKKKMVRLFFSCSWEEKWRH